MQPQDIKEGMIFYECSRGYNMKFLACGDVVVSTIELDEKLHTQYKWEGLHEMSNEIIQFRAVGSFAGPSIYGEPQYVSIPKGGGEPYFKFI